MAVPFEVRTKVVKGVLLTDSHISSAWNAMYMERAITVLYEGQFYVDKFSLSLLKQTINLTFKDLKKYNSSPSHLTHLPATCYTPV